MDLVLGWCNTYLLSATMAIPRSMAPSCAAALPAAPPVPPTAPLYDYLLIRQERYRVLDRLVWPYGPALLALGALLQAVA